VLQLFESDSVIEATGIGALREFVRQLIVEMQCCANGLAVAVFYMYRLKRRFIEYQIRTSECNRQLVAVCLMCATKYLYDVPFTNKQWAKVSQLRLADLNRMERELLHALDYNFSVNLPQVQHIAQFLAESPVAAFTPTFTACPAFPSPRRSLLDRFTDVPDSYCCTTDCVYDSPVASPWQLPQAPAVRLAPAPAVRPAPASQSFSYFSTQWPSSGACAYHPVPVWGQPLPMTQRCPVYFSSH